MAALAQLPGYLPIGRHTAQVFDRLEALEPKVIAGHHSPTYTGNVVQALRDLRDLRGGSSSTPASNRRSRQAQFSAQFYFAPETSSCRLSNASRAAWISSR